MTQFLNASVFKMLLLFNIFTAAYNFAWDTSFKLSFSGENNTVTLLMLLYFLLRRFYLICFCCNRCRPLLNRHIMTSSVFGDVAVDTTDNREQLLSRRSQ